MDYIYIIYIYLIGSVISMALIHGFITKYGGYTSRKDYFMLLVVAPLLSFIGVVIFIDAMRELKL